MAPIDKLELNSLFMRSLDGKMRMNIQIISEEDSFPEVHEFDTDKRHQPFLTSRWEVHDLALLMGFTGNLDAPVP